MQLIKAHRFNGHRQSDLNPLQHYKRQEITELEPEFHRLEKSDMDKVFNTGSLFAADELSLGEIIHIIKRTYCHKIGTEYMHVNETSQRRWLQKRLEESKATPNFNAQNKINILQQVIHANVLEQYLHKRYVGQKRFSLEGGDSLIPLLNEVIQKSGANNIKEIVIGMAHRGRLNVLVNTIGKKPSELFSEFEGQTSGDLEIDELNYMGDVKYHLGYSSDVQTDGGPVHLTLAFNPSHLEIIDPVVQGSVRARQERRQDRDHAQVLPILIHGDAAFAGQGVVMETFNLSQTRGYTTGGTVHIIINNQIGFTTSDPLDSRSSLYCTDVAKMIQAPIFHVNGDDPEAVVYIAQLALDFRLEFKKDVIIDMVCYRRHGHSEADEPSTTQPIMYQHINKHKTVREIYAAQLIDEKVITDDHPAIVEKTYIQRLKNDQRVTGSDDLKIDKRYAIDFSAFHNTHWQDTVSTAISEEDVARLTTKITTLPENFQLHKSVNRIVNDRKLMGKGDAPMDWGYAEHMALASLLDAGYPIRLSGQDSGRGTFFHRHAVIHNQSDGNTHLPLQHISDDQAKFLVINSTLSEEAVLGYEYGYSSAEPNALVIWEAQFGDFANGAQVVFDQFISSCEAKWGRYCGLVVFLPHGFDGQGPEHSSARLERYLQLCAGQNMQVCYPSTAAQMFHMLRRQMVRPYRKPLIVMSPKSLLRRKLSTSPVSELTQGCFHTVIGEIDELAPNDVTRLLLCSGKIYYDLLEKRREHKIKDIAIVRIEQLFPFPKEDVIKILQQYPQAQEVVWVQEEPQNQGSWYYTQSQRTILGCIDKDKTYSYVGRPYSASPATGLMMVHNKQQQHLIHKALKIDII